jgi:hypothetical protein
MIECRKEYLTRYLQYEHHVHRWIQTSTEEAEDLEKQGFIPRNSGYWYTDDDGKQMVEFHIDY